MNTRIGNTEQDIIIAAELIRKGEVVAFPTETVYGLGGNALDSAASRKIYEVKGRPSDNPLIVHLADPARLNEVAYPTRESELLISAFCPGPLTMILKKRPVVPDETTGGRQTVAVRFPSHPIARALIQESGYPIAAPSANVSKHVSPTSASHVYQDLKGRIPLILDGGECAVGIESTIVDLTGDFPVILRPGAITAEEIRRVLGAGEYFNGEITEALAPGMKYKHYSPSVPCYLAEKGSLKSALESLKSKGLRPLLIATEDTCRDFPEEETLSLGDSAKKAQHLIYGALRASEGYGAALIEDLSDKKEYYAAMDRIKKATGGNRI